MQRASNLFNEADRQRINEAVAAAEGKTSAEVVPAVATASGRYDRAEDIIGLWLACIALGVAFWLLPSKPAHGDWEGLSTPGQMLILIVVVVVAFILGAVLGSRIGWLRRLFTPLEHMQDEVALRARQVFFDQRVHHTAGAGGVLVYISLFEHMATVVADQTVLEKLGEGRITELCADLTGRLKQGPPADAICHVIHKLGDLLSDPLPRAADDVNELPDALVLVD